MPRRPIVELTRARLLVFLREPEAVFWVFVFPLVLALVLGFAFSERDSDPTRIGVIRAPDLEAWTSLLSVDPEIQVSVFDDEASARQKLRKGTLDGLVKPGTPPEIRYDPKRPEGKMAELRIQRVLDGRGALVAPADGTSEAALKVVPESERGSRYIDFLYPGLVGMNLMGSGIWGIGFGVVDTRQKKLLKRLLVTPMRRSSFLLSFVLARFGMLAAEVIVLFAFGVLVLDIPFTGGQLAFACLCVLGGLSFSGLGLLVASRARTLEGISGLTNLVMMPMWLCSGVFFSYERFPEFLHPAIRLLPLTAVNDALRLVFLDGAGMLEILPQLLVIGVFGLFAFTTALLIFRWE